MRLLLLVSILAAISISCHSNNGDPEHALVKGATMGTNYTIKVNEGKSSIIKPAIDSILEQINLAVSTYIPHSTISVINTDSLATVSYHDGEDSIRVYNIPIDSHFMKNFSISKKYHNDSHGFFDPTVMPLVNYWGFGTTGKQAVTSVDSAKVRRLLALTDFSKWILTIDSTVMTVQKPAFSQIDFSAVAKGYAVDYLAEYLDKLSFKNYMVEIGGELRTRGTNPKNELWSIGLSRPIPEASNFDFEAIIELDNMSLASSGNYRNFYKVENKIYGHEINPTTGYPEINALLGVSVLSKECAPSDAMATAFMVMGLERTKSWLNRQSEMNAVLFYQDANGEILYYASPLIQMKLLN